MKFHLRRIYCLLVLFGFDPIKTFRAAKGLPAYFQDFLKFSKQKRASANELPFGKLYPCFEDRPSDSGTTRGHYFHQDLLVARRVFQNNPATHVDVGSRIDGFVAHVASYRKIEVFDIRTLPGSIPNIKFTQADLMSTLPDRLTSYCDSLSCLHALEHFGLGRYGDPINFDGHLLGLNNLKLILKRDGKLYFSVPIGPPRIEFNAHRVFSVGSILNLFQKQYRLDQFSFVDDNGDLHENITITETDISRQFGCTFGCGIFEMTKL